MTRHVISQSAFARQESNFGGSNVSFEISFREKKIFKYVHVQMALPKKKNFKSVFFCDEILLAGAAVRLFNSLQIIKNLLVKARGLHSMLKVVKKNLG